MRKDALRDLGLQIKDARARRKLTQPALAARLGRDRARISELERDLLNERLGRDRLALLLEICDACDITPMLVPTAKLSEVRTILASASARSPSPQAPSTAFDDVFVDLSDDEEA
ncbi:helix-turn-helix transcriptional regulator [Xanthobacter agilis]|uniref:Transcriptional regulator with XRE-family HTH domain n=2 Tax=Xanthobacter agilis TaxID=47492 RepID=A0ABU0LJP2_XANAG|nr:transcriptional regulator with XRE-family HTH domain [Xanthobacter agilis]